MQDPKTEGLRTQLGDLKRQLAALRDEVRLHAHLGSMELKQKWSELEPRFHEAEQLVAEATQASRAALQDLVRRYRELRDAIVRLRERQRLARH